ncbi:hypothetical protein KEM54_002236, partial [Ascosphaera aggregata]
ATPPPEDELVNQSKFSADRPTPSLGSRQAGAYPPWASNQHGARSDLFKQAASRLGPPPRIDPFAANRPVLRPDVLTPSSAKSFPQIPTSLWTSRYVPPSPAHPAGQRSPLPHSAASSTPGSSAQSITTHSPAAGRFPVNGQQQSAPKGSNYAASNLEIHDHPGLPGRPPVTPVTPGKSGTPFMTSEFSNDLTASLSPQQGAGQPSSREQAQLQRNMSIDSTGAHSGNHYQSRGLNGPPHKDVLRQPADFATVPASSATPGGFCSTTADAEQPRGATGRVRGYSSSYGPPSPTSEYAPSHAPTDSVYSTATKSRSDNDFSVTQIARYIGLVGDARGLYIDDEEVDMRLKGPDSQPKHIDEEPQGMDQSTRSESRQGSQSSGFNAKSTSTGATSTSDSQDYRMNGARDARLASARSNHWARKSSLSSIAGRFKGGRRYSASRYDKSSPNPVAHSPIEGVSAFRRSSVAENIASLEASRSIMSPVEASFSLGQGIRRLRGSQCDPMANILRNGGLPTPSPSAEKLAACQRISETQEPVDNSQPGSMPRHGVRRESRAEPESRSSIVVAAPPAHASPTLSSTSTSSCKQRVRSRCRGCNEFIVGKSVSSADGRLTGRWHRKCFRCATCREPFATGDFYVHGNEPYCAQHYHELNGSLCAACNKGIEGIYLETEGIKDEKSSWGANDNPRSQNSQSLDASRHSTSSPQENQPKKKYHPECFKCATCQVVLRGDYFEWNGLPYCERDSRLAAGIIPTPIHSADQSPPPTNRWNDFTPDAGAWPHYAYPNSMQSSSSTPPHPQACAAPADFRRPMPPNYPGQGYFGPLPPGYRRPGPPGPPVAPGPPGAMSPWGPPSARPPHSGYPPVVPYPPPANIERFPPQRGLPPGSDPYYGDMRVDFGHYAPGRVPHGRGPWVPGPNGPMPTGVPGTGMPYQTQRRFPERRTTKLTFI